jgi:hypothetical protein
MNFSSNVTSIVLAKLLSTNRSTITRLTNRGILKKTAKGYDVIASIAAHTAHREALVAARHGEGALGQARCKLVIEKAAMAAIQRARMESSVIPADEVTARWEASAVAVKTKFLAGPNKLGAVLAAESTPAGCAAILRNHVNENLESLSRGAYIQKAGS